MAKNRRGGIPGRKIDCTLSLFRDIIQDAENRNCPGALIGIDLAKAYDRVNRKLVCQIMEAMGYPIDFIEKLQVLYFKVRIKIRVNNENTETFEGLNGLRQGVPTLERKPLSFTICISITLPGNPLDT